MFAAMLNLPKPGAPSVEYATRATVILADDHPIVARELRRILQQEFDVIAQVADGDALVAAAEALRPQVIVTDICMPRRSGLDAAEAILAAGIPSHLIFVSIHTDPAMVRRALSFGKSSFVHKLAAGEELIPAVQAALKGNRYVAGAGAGDEEHNYESQDE